MEFDDNDRKSVEGKGRVDIKTLVDVIHKKAMDLYTSKEKSLGDKTIRDLERYFFIQSIDHHWKEHLLALDHLKEGIHLRGYAQKDPLVEYRKEGFELFKLLDKAIRQAALSKLYTVRLLSPEEQEAQRREQEDLQRISAERMAQAQMSGPSLDALDAPEVANAERSNGHGPGEQAPPPENKAGVNAAMSFMKKYQEERMRQLKQTSAGSSLEEIAVTPVVSEGPKLGRNDPCFCGSGKKYKQCHGKNS